MEEQILKFRVLLVQLSNQLSDENREGLHFIVGSIAPRKLREGLHFIVGSIAPRKLRDDCTPSGTLHLLEFLFDSALLSEQRLDYLIHALHETGAHDTLERLREFERFERTRTLSTTSVSSPIWNEPISTNMEVDKLANVSIDVIRGVSYSFSDSEKSSPNSDCSLLSSTTILSRESQLLFKSSIYPRNQSKQSLSILRKMVKRQLNALSILLLLTNILLFLLFVFLNLSKCSTSHHLLSKSSISQDLNYIVKEGFMHGVQGKFSRGKFFDDGKDLNLSYVDRCVGIELYWVNNYLASIRFFYSNGRSSAVHRPLKNNQLDRFPRSSNNFTLNVNEEINKVIFYERADRSSLNNSLMNIDMKDGIVGIQFRTTKGRRSDLFGSDDGRFTDESFAGYTFLCAKGRIDDFERIEMVQLIWIKQSSRREKINEKTVYSLSTCSFTTEIDLEVKEMKGVETSWYDLKGEFNLHGESCRPGASYYRTISIEGRDLFAVIMGKHVFYHDRVKWVQDHSAKNPKSSVIDSFDLHPPRIRVNTHQ